MVAKINIYLKYDNMEMNKAKIIYFIFGWIFGFVLAFGVFVIIKGI